MYLDNSDFLYLSIIDIYLLSNKVSAYKSWIYIDDQIVDTDSNQFTAKYDRYENLWYRILFIEIKQVFINRKYDTHWNEHKNELHSLEELLS